MRLPELLGVSVFALHITAIVVAAVPSPERLAAVTSERESSDDRLARLVRPNLDALIPALERSTSFAWRLTRPVRPVLARYTRTFRLTQSWRMFAEPPLANQYIAVCADYGSPHGVRKCEIVEPAIPPGRFKGLAAYRPGFRDKALSNAAHAFLQERANGTLAGIVDGRTRYGADVLQPIGRYLRPSASGASPVQRLEVWRGAVRIAPRGEPPTSELAVASWPIVDLPGGRYVGAIERRHGADWLLMWARNP